MAGRPRTRARVEQESALMTRDGRRLGSKRKAVKITDESTLSKEEKEWKQTYAIFLKASDYSYSYISNALNVSKAIVRGWFEDEKVRAQVSEIQSDLASGGTRLLKLATVELVEMLLELARTTQDPGIKLRAITEGLDRIGVSKVNKSESLSTTIDGSEVKLSDPDNLLERIADMPMEKQQQIARAAAALEAAMTEQP